MRREIMTHGQIIELTREVIHGFYSRSVDHLLDYLHDDFVWIGAFAFQFTVGKQQFLDTIQSELNSIPFSIYDEHFNLIARDRDTLIVYCDYRLRAPLSEDKLMQSHTRMTVIWRYADNAPKIIHIHGSNAQDIPLTITTSQPNITSTNDNFIDYLVNTGNLENFHKIVVRSTSGKHYIIPECDIFYLEANGQNTKVYTRDNTLQISGILRTHQEKLSDSFFRCHKSFLVNLPYVTSYCRYRLVMTNQGELPISKERYLTLKQRILDLANTQ